MDTNEIFKKTEKQGGVTNLQNFADRQKNLFDQLITAEKTVGKTFDENSEQSSIDMVEMSTPKRKSVTRHLQGRESIFKRPEAPLSKCLPRKSAPDFKRNPHKWIKYSLSDVKTEDMSEQSNTAAALSFLREMEERKSVEEEEDDMECEDTSKIVFKSNKNKIRFSASATIASPPDSGGGGKNDDGRPSFRGSKVVMPEYVIGQKKSVSKKCDRLQSTGEKKAELKLDHLLEEDDGD